MNSIRRELLMTGLVYDSLSTTITVPDGFYDSFKRVRGDSPENHALAVASAYCQSLYIPIGLLCICVSVDQWEIDVRIIKHSPIYTVALVQRYTMINEHFLRECDAAHVHCITRIHATDSHGVYHPHSITGNYMFTDLENNAPERAMMLELIDHLYPNDTGIY